MSRLDLHGEFFPDRGGEEGCAGGCGVVVLLLILVALPVCAKVMMQYPVWLPGIIATVAANYLVVTSLKKAAIRVDVIKRVASLAVRDGALSITVDTANLQRQCHITWRVVLVVASGVVVTLLSAVAVLALANTARYLLLAASILSVAGVLICGALLASVDKMTAIAAVQVRASLESTLLSDYSAASQLCDRATMLAATIGTEPQPTARMHLDDVVTKTLPLATHDPTSFEQAIAEVKTAVLSDIRQLEHAISVVDDFKHEQVSLTRTLLAARLSTLIFEVESIAATVEESRHFIRERKWSEFFDQVATQSQRLAQVRTAIAGSAEYLSPRNGG
jgi:hypothetical protein